MKARLASAPSDNSCRCWTTWTWMEPSSSPGTLPPACIWKKAQRSSRMKTAMEFACSNRSHESRCSRRSRDDVGHHRRWLVARDLARTKLSLGDAAERSSDRAALCHAPLEYRDRLTEHPRRGFRGNMAGAPRDSI